MSKASLAATVAIAALWAPTTASAHGTAPTIRQAKALLRAEYPHGHLRACQRHGRTVRCRLRVEMEGTTGGTTIIVSGECIEAVRWRGNTLVAWELP